MIRKPDPTERDAMDAERCRQLWCKVIVNAINEAITENAKSRLGPQAGTESFKRWAWSRDGREVASNAGFVLDDRTIARAVEIINDGTRLAHREAIFAVLADRDAEPEPIQRTQQCIVPGYVEAEARAGA